MRESARRRIHGERTANHGCSGDWFADDSLWVTDQSVIYWQTMVFTTLVVAQLAQALAIRSELDSLFTIGISSNPYLLGAVLLTVGAQLLAIYHSAFNELLKTTPLTTQDLMLCFGLGIVVFPSVEVNKWIRRRMKQAPVQ